MSTNFHIIVEQKLLLWNKQCGRRTDAFLIFVILQFHYRAKQRAETMKDWIDETSCWFPSFTFHVLKAKDCMLNLIRCKLRL